MKKYMLCELKMHDIFKHIIINFFITWYVCLFFRDEPNSNVRLMGAMNSKDVSMNIETNARKMGLSHSLEKSASKLRSSGKLFWNSGIEDQVSYDLKMSDVTRRNNDISDMTFRLGLPSRTLELSGSTM